MKQLLQYAGSGETKVVDVPAPRVAPGTVLVQVAASVVSAGTERSSVEFSRKSLLGKARARPDLVRQVLQRMRTDGLLTAWDLARARLDQPAGLGYACAGTVVEVGEGVVDVRPGDLVACAGAGYAVHAELVCVPRNLVAKVPEGVDLEAAAFSTLGAIALHGVRLAEVQIGERVAIIGLGLLGLLVVQIVRAAGGRVLGIDVDASRVDLARGLGIEPAIAYGSGAGGGGAGSAGAQSAADALSGGQGMDAVIITAATKSHAPVHLAGELARDRARIVVIGAVGMDIPRNLYYEKELELRVARSYGPGRYDPTYEEGGNDYPIGYVRWTENRNMEAFLELVARDQVQVAPLVTHRFPIQRAERAYELIAGRARESYLGIVITYPMGEVAATVEDPRGPHATNAAGGGGLAPRRIQIRPPASTAIADGVVRIGVLGVGNFATGTLLPALAKVAGTDLVGVCTSNGARARHAADRFGFRYCATEEDAILHDPTISTIVIATRHHLHARQAMAALQAGKHVFCEKPLCLNERELRELVRTISARPALRLMVGYNRRFAPMIRTLKAFLADVREPLVMQWRVNAGFVPAEHWVQDPAQGGGRVIGELCHFVDSLAYLAGSPPVSVYARAAPNHGRYRDDNLTVTLQFVDGSVGNIAYAASGDRAAGKERLEVFGGASSAVLDDFRSLLRVRGGKRVTDRVWLRQDKGHRTELQAFVHSVRTGEPGPLSLEELVSVSLTTFRILDSLRTGEPQSIDAAPFIASCATPDAAAGVETA